MGQNHFFIILFLFSLSFFSCQNKSTESKRDHNEKKNSLATVEDVERGIREYISSKQKKNDGVFHLKTDTAEYDMRLVRVHSEYLSVLGPGKYFACVDLAVESGDVYDIDFFMEGTPDDMTVTETTFHKLNGKPYYTWKQKKDDKTWFKVPVEKADRSLMGIVEGEDAFEFYYTITLPDISGFTRLWLPQAQSDAYQTIKIVEKSFPEDPRILEDAIYGNKAYYLEVDESHSGEEIKITYDVKRKEKSPFPSETKSLSKFLSSNTLIPVNKQFKTIADSAIKRSGATDTLMMARALFDYVIDSMKYIKDGKYGTGDAVYACDAQSGNCTEFHSFFIALARSSGIASRFGIGAAIPSNRDEGGVNGYHCWAEFYANGKWWPVDISEANKYSALATYYFGHHPANRIEFSKGRDLIFSEMPATGPINFFAYPVMEVEGVIVRPEVTFTFVRKQKSPYKSIEAL